MLKNEIPMLWDKIQMPYYDMVYFVKDMLKLTIIQHWNSKKNQFLMMLSPPI